MKRAELGAAHYKTFSGVRLFASSFGVQMNEGIQFRLQRLDAFQMEFDKFDGRNISNASRRCNRN